MRERGFFSMRVCVLYDVKIWGVKQGAEGVLHLKR